MLVLKIVFGLFFMFHCHHFTFLSRVQCARLQVGVLTFVCACGYTSECASVCACVYVCSPTCGNAICIFCHTASTNVLRYLHADLISMVTRGRRAARRPMRRRRHRRTASTFWLMLRHPLVCYEQVWAHVDPLLSNQTDHFQPRSRHTGTMTLFWTLRPQAGNGNSPVFGLCLWRKFSLYGLLSWLQTGQQVPELEPPRSPWSLFTQLYTNHSL